MSIKRHSFYNLIGAIAPLLLSLLTIPVYLGLIGEERFGVLAIAWLLLGYFGLFDLGLGRATAQRIASQKDSTAERRAETFWTACLINLLLGVFGGILIWPAANYFFSDIFQIQENFRGEVIAAIPWLVLAVPMATFSGVLTGALQGRERFLELNIVSILGAALFQLLPLAAAAFFSEKLTVLLPAALFARLLTLIALFLICNRHIILGNSPQFSRRESGILVRFGGWVTISSFIGPIMVILDRFVIGAFIGAKAVSYYTVPFQLAERSTVLSKSLASALFPRFASHSDQEHQLAVRGLILVAVVTTPMIGFGILIMNFFLEWWISPEFAAESAQVGKILLFGFWFNSFAVIPYAQLQAKGRPDLPAICHAVEIIPYLGLLYVGLTNFGLIGAAAAFSIRVIVDFLFLSFLSNILAAAIKHLLFPTVFLVLALTISVQTDFGDPAYSLYVLAYLVAVMVWAYIKAPEPLRSYVRRAAAAISK